MSSRPRTLVDFLARAAARTWTVWFGVALAGGILAMFPPSTRVL